MFAKKLRCSCGHTFRKNIWYRGKHGNTYGYTCYSVLNKPIYSDNPEFVPVCQYIIDEEYAKEYAKKHHQIIHKSSWQDITVDVQIAL